MGKPSKTGPFVAAVMALTSPQAGAQNHSGGLCVLGTDKHGMFVRVYGEDSKLELQSGYLRDASGDLLQKGAKGTFSAEGYMITKDLRQGGPNGTYEKDVLVPSGTALQVDINQWVKEKPVGFCNTASEITGNVGEYPTEIFFGKEPEGLFKPPVPDFKKH